MASKTTRRRSPGNRPQVRERVVLRIGKTKPASWDLMGSAGREPKPRAGSPGLQLPPAPGSMLDFMRPDQVPRGSH